MAIRVTPAIARRWLADVPQEMQFWCVDGKPLKNLAELEQALKEMSEETYLYHANAFKKDFSDWVKHVIGDETLSGYLLRSISPAEAAERVRDRVTWLQKKAGT